MYPPFDAQYGFISVLPLFKAVPDYSHPSNFQFPQYYAVTYLSSYQQHDYLAPVVPVDSHSVPAIMSYTANAEQMHSSIEETRKRRQKRTWKRTGKRTGKRDTSHIMAPTFWG